MWDSQGKVQYVAEHSHKAKSPICKMSVKKNSFAVKVLLYQAVQCNCFELGFFFFCGFWFCGVFFKAKISLLEALQGTTMLLREQQVWAALQVEEN